ncbi:MAG: TrkA C-terminal domain-containing protein [Nitrospiraceae bacterium]|nr:TrkA C-terminal domain-containing protein [Nitrospiraceae bacterium]
MSFELLGRIQQELSITGSAIYETVLALSERANRKVQVLRLHNHASNLLSQIEQGHGDLGRHIVALSAKRSPLTPESPPSSNQLGHVLGQAGDRIQQLKQTLLNVDSQIRELKLETIHHELLTLQQDLSLRTAAIERLTIVRGSPVIGKRLAEVALPPSVRLVTILRGPFLVSPDNTLVLRADDILIMVGLQVDLALVSSDFTHARNGTSA